MNSNHLPKNTTIPLPPGSSTDRAEIFWQTTNCQHFMDNHREDAAKSSPSEKIHNLRFPDVSKMLSGNVLITPIARSRSKYQAVASWNGKYYLTIFTLERRPFERSTLFAIIVTTYITYDSQHIEDYKEYIKLIRQTYGK